MLAIISGVSGAGKNTVIQRLLKEFDNIFYFKSATTRPRREGEDFYDYMTDAEFVAKKNAGEFFETECTHGFWYATQNKELEKIVQNPHNIYIKDIDVHGNKKLREHFKTKATVVSIFLDAPDDVLYQRLISRGESDERARVRLSRGKMEREHKHDYDLVIENLDLDKTVNTIKEFIKSRL